MWARESLISLAKARATELGVDPALICAICEQESAWDPWAIRPESGVGGAQSAFERRYGTAYANIVQRTASRIDDHWYKYEDLFYCSYGLMQVLYCVFVETFPEIAIDVAYPTQLCGPATNIEIGCRLFKRKLATAKGDVRKALLFWNGGGNLKYPDEVLARVDKYK